MPRSARVFIILTFAAVLFSPHAMAGEPMRVEIKGPEAVVSYVVGYATLHRMGEKAPRLLKKDDTLKGGDRINTGRSSRLEITMPDKSVVRFGQRSSFTIAAMAYNVEEKTKDSHFRMFLGRVWAKVKKLGRKDRFQVSSRTAVAGVRGTTYRMNVGDDSTTQVKVYGGDVLVQGHKKVSQAQGPGALAPAGKSLAPTRVSGPTAVSAPKPVTMETWTYLVSSMQEITVSPDGSASAPVSFTAEEDTDPWVTWNQERDAALARPEPAPLMDGSTSTAP